ncbi:MAG: TolC family protein [Spirochaetes bacterium]|nr:TolC family protein [Spirochaetota bacterium]
MRIKILVIVLLGNQFFFLSAYSRSVTVDECVQIAYQHHPEIKAAIENQDAAVSNYKIAAAGSNVVIDASAKTVEYLNPDRSPGQVNIPGKDTTIGLFAGLAASYNIYDPRISISINIHKVNVDVAKLNTMLVRNRVALGVKKAYYQYALARESTLYREKLMKKFHEKLLKIEVLHKMGQSSALEVSRAQLDYETAKLDYDRSKNTENAMKTNLLISMGIIDEGIDFAPVVEQNYRELKYALDELYNFAQQNSYEIKSVLLRKEMGKMNIELQKASRHPRVDIQAAFGMENRNLQNKEAIKDGLMGNNWSPTFHAGFTASMPVYSGGAISARIDKSLSEYNAVLYEEKKLNLNIKSQIRSNYYLLIELSKQLQNSQLMVQNAEKHLKLTQHYYERGQSTQMDVSNAELSLLGAQLAAVRTKYDYLITKAELAHLVGLKEEQICK